jgi:NAD(P)-dependent dehydrogenase (short-subunit alcohol dehydrogenase family)
MFARSGDYLTQLASEIKGQKGSALSVPTDITDPEQVKKGFQLVREQFGPIDILINHAGNAMWGGVQDITPDHFSQAWRVGPYASFLCTQEVVPDMVKKEKGAILFSGATSSIRGRGGAVAFTSAKFGVRGLAESLARELWPYGIHVAHVVIDGAIDTPWARQGSVSDPNEPLLHPDAMAEAYWNLATQDKQAWTLELDLRPFNEDFFV